MRLPLTDRGIFFGDGIYDAAIARGESIYLCDEHIERFIGNARTVSIPFAFSHDELAELLRECVRRSGYGESFIYFQLTAYADERRHAPRDSERSNLFICVKPHALPSSESSLKLISYPDIRQSFCHIKTINLLGSVMASCAADAAGADEAVFIRDGYVTECAHSNIFIINDTVLLTHPLTEKILPGITRARIIKAARELGISVAERAFSLSELISADDVLISSTSRLAQRANLLDGVKIACGNHTIGDSIMAQMCKDFEKTC